MKKLLLLTLIVFAIAACNKYSDNVQQEGFVLPVVAGGDWDFKAENKTKPVVMAFMATYCAFCKQMVPYIDDIAAKYKDKGVEVVIALVETDKDKAEAFVKEQNVKNAKVLYDAGDLAMTVSVRAFPQIFLFDDKTNSIGTWRGYDPAYEKSITEQVEALLARPQEPSSTMPRENA